MKKRGQIAIFVILAIFITSVIILFLTIPKKQSSNKLPESEKVHNFIKQFINKEVFTCLEKIGKQGGYDAIPSELFINNTSYWYKNRTIIQPSIKKIEWEIENCSRNLLKNSAYYITEKFPNNSVEINKERIDIEAKINQDTISIKVFYPTVIKEEKSSSIISDFNLLYKVRLKDLYDEATKILENTILPEFDKCNPQKYVEEGINFTFFTEEDNLIIKGQEIIIFENGTSKPYELVFGIKRHIQEAFGENKKKLAILYQDNSDWPTFGGKFLEILFNEVKLNAGVDTYDCNTIPNFINKIDNYDVIIITGDLQFQIVSGIAGTNPDNWHLLYGCNQFNKEERKKALKNWVNEGGVLWINDVSKSESDNFIVSYLGFLGYGGGQWESLPLGSLFDMQSFILNQIIEKKSTIKPEEIKNHIILHCPNNIINELEGTWFDRTMQVTNQDEIIIGNKNEAILWIRNIGKGFVIFDEFLLKDNLYEKTGFNNDLYSKELAGKYFVNILNYLAKQKKSTDQTNIRLITPAEKEIINFPYFRFSSELDTTASYSLYLTNLTGRIFKIILDENILKSSTGNYFDINLSTTYNSDWGTISNGLYEWQIEGLYNGKKYFSNINSFIKNNTQY